MNSSSRELRRSIMAVVTQLSEEEQALLREVLQIERKQLHSAKPRVKEDILDAVRRHIK